MHNDRNFVADALACGDGFVFPIVSTFKYLGLEFDRQGCDSHMVQAILTKAKKAYGALLATIGL